MPVAVDPKQVHRYTLECDRALPENEQSVFLITAQTVRCEKEAHEALQKGTAFAFVLVVLKHCLVGWENFKLSDGTDAPFEVEGNPKRVTEKSLGYLHQAHLDELATAISKLGSTPLGENELKN